MENKEEQFENIPMISQPQDFDINLYPHQRAIVHKMESREKDQTLIISDDTIIDMNIGINSDLTGYGKTISMLALVHRDKMSWDLTVPYVQSITTSFASGRIKKTFLKKYEKLDSTLVLVSQSIINQWYQECQKTPLSVVKITTKKLVDTVFIPNYDIVLVTPSMYNKLVSKYVYMAWKRFIFDEPGHMKVPGMFKIIAGFNWFVTATPISIIATHRACRNSFMYDIFATFFFDQLPYMIVKNDDDFVRYSFTMPQTYHNYYKCYNQVYQTVSGFVTPRIAEMISAGNINGAIKALGGGETKNITEIIRKMKMDEIDVIKSRIEIFIIRNKKTDSLVDRIKVIENQLNDLDNRYSEILSGDCNICLEKISNPVMEPNCQNVFCGSCLLKWLETKPTCPLCRGTIKTSQLMYINDEKNNHTPPPPCDNSQLQTKVNTVINLIKSKPDGKYIIFSSWDQTFAPIRNILSSNNINYIEIGGSISSRIKSIQEFRTGNINVIFLNSRYNGYGINLPETTDIIIYHEMGETTINQIIGRANRIGRKDSLYVHHLQI